ncbi:MAG: hypothetical protein EOP88_05015 [Verrucomicrobiaceae bacterium]|nr:MAG: hypothetical protein EOP88_05015 [Verrucomicrobiaceae bacterium]
MSTELPKRRGTTPPPLRQASFDESPLLSLTAGIRRCMRMAGFGRIVVWLALAICAALALDLASGLPPRLRATAGVVILGGAAILVVRHFWYRPRQVTTDRVTREVETSHPEFGQLLSTARDPSVSNASVSPVLKNELFRRASVSLAGLDLRKNLPKRPVRRWLAAGVVALAAFCFFMSSNREAPVALARLVSPFSDITYTRVANSTPDPTFDRNRLPRVEATVSGRPAQTVTIHITQPEGGDAVYPMNPLGGGRFEVTLPASGTSFAFRIQAGDSMPVEGAMECVDPAEFVSSTAEIALPDYTGQPVAQQDNADIEAVEGTRATLRFRMSAPMKSAQLKLPDGKKLNLDVKGDELSKTFAVGIGGDVAELTGTDARGHDIEPVQFKHKGVEDALPVVEWIEPTKDIEATAIAELPLRLRLRDDFGVASYGVVLQAQGQSKEIITKKLEAKDLRDLSEMTSAALEAFPLTIRDNVRVFAWATDHKPRENARGVSKLRGVDIKPFKRKWQMLKGEGGMPPISGEDLVKVDQLIKTQREILSDAFTAIQGPPPSTETAKGFGDRETKTQQDARKLHAAVLEEGQWPADDVSLLYAASSQMGESANAWYTVRHQMGFDRGDAALSSLLELRKNLLTLLIKADCPCLEPKPEEVPVTLTDLAAEAERIAKEEHDVANQLVANPDADRLEAIRRQQHVANSDTGELYARLMDHPENTPLVLSQMDEAEKAVRETTRTTTSSSAVAQAPPLANTAAEKLEQVAKTLRALDETKIDDTLAEMAKDAKKAAEAAKPKDDQPKDDQPKEEEKKEPGEQAAKEPGEKPGDKPSDKPGDKPAKEPGEQASKEAGDKPGDKPSDKAGEKPGDKPGDKPGAGEGDKPAQAAGKKPGEGKGEGKSPSDKPGKGQGKGAGQGEGESEMAGEGKGSGQGKGAGQGEQPGELAEGDGKEAGAGKGGDKQELAANDPDAGNSSGPGEKSGEAKGQGPAATPGKPGEKDPAEQRKDELAKAARQSAMNDEILKFLAEREAKSGQPSRLEKLREENASDKFDEKLNDVAGEKTDGSKTAEELKAFAAALEQEREVRRQSRLESLAENREKAAELKKQAEAKRDAAKKAAQEMARNSGGFSFEIPKEVMEEAKTAGQGEGDKPSTEGKGKGPGEGKGEGQGPGNGPGAPSPGQGTKQLARNLDALKDTELSRIARELEKDAPDISQIRPLAEAERRLAAMIEELSGVARGDDSGGVVPPAYRRAVEDYYRALSDDFGDEEAVPR